MVATYSLHKVAKNLLTQTTTQKPSETNISEMDVPGQYVCHARLPVRAGCSTSLSPPIFHCRASPLPHNSVPNLQPWMCKRFTDQFQVLRVGTGRKVRSLGVVVVASQSEITATAVVEERWLLEPAGDGDSRHIGFKVEMPGAFEIASSEVTVGRLPDKADMVIPVATVSALHARIRKEGENLLVTDLDSTNGTFIGDKRLRPGVAATLTSGSFVTFGDIHLAKFRATKLENKEDATQAKESEDKVDNENPTEGNEAR